MTEATHFSQCVHDQQRRLEADDCDSIRCAQLISGGRRRIRPPCTVPRSRSPHNVLHSPSRHFLCIYVYIYMLYVIYLYATVTVLLTLRSISVISSKGPVAKKSDPPWTPSQYFLRTVGPRYNWASVSEPHTCDFNATFSPYVISRPSLYF